MDERAIFAWNRYPTREESLQAAETLRSEYLVAFYYPGEDFDLASPAYANPYFDPLPLVSVQDCHKLPPALLLNRIRRDLKDVLFYGT